MALCAIVNSPHEAPYCTIAKSLLFPESPVLNGIERWAQALRNDTEDFGRVTLTFPLLNRTRMAVFLVVGEEKAQILKKVISCAEAFLCSLRNPFNTWRAIKLVGLKRGKHLV